MPVFFTQICWKNLIGNLSVILAHPPGWASVCVVHAWRKASMVFVLCLLSLLQEAANWFLRLADVWHARSTYLLCQYYCKVGSQIFSDFFFFWIQDLLFRKAVMFHQSWGKLRPFFYYYTRFHCNFHDKLYICYK